MMNPDRPAENEEASAPRNDADEQPEEGPVSLVHLTLELPPGSRVKVRIEALTGSGSTGSSENAEVQITAPGFRVENSTESSVIILEGAESGAVVKLQSSVEEAPGLRQGRSGSSAASGVDGTALTSVSLIPATSPGSGGLARIGAAWEGFLRYLARAEAIPAVLFTLALLVYLATRLIGLTDFPIYFFTDEAVQTVLAADLVRDGLRDYDRVLLPTFFKNGTQYNLGVSVYLQVLPYLLFGKSVFVTRAVSVLVTLLAAGGVGILLRDFFKIRYWWTGVLLLSITPAWFLHSRTAFETVLMVSFYTGALYAYLLYRCRSPHYLYACLILAGLAFYSYSPGQAVVVLTGLILLLVDARYHWQNRNTVLGGALLAILLALPYLRFRFLHPTALEEHLSNLSSYWVLPLPLKEKLARFGSEYLFGLNPSYWFVPNERDLARHRFGEVSHLLRFTLPLLVIGLILSLRRLRSPAHRLALIAALVSPTGGALAQIGITRVLVFVIPAALFSSLGLDWLLNWLAKYMPRLGHLIRGTPANGRVENSSTNHPGNGAAQTGNSTTENTGTEKSLHGLVAITTFAILVLINFGMMREALVNGATWHRDYGLGGMQYGAKQVFSAVKDYLRQHPGETVIVSPTWANGTDVVARFFFNDPLPFQMGSVVGHIERRLPLTLETLFVMTPEEFELARSSEKFKTIDVEKTLPYPDGRPGFYFTHLEYVDNIDEILAAEQAARQVLLQGEIDWQGQRVQIRYPNLDIGEIWNAFDGDLDTLIRSAEANPLVIEMRFQKPVEISEIYLKFGSAQIKVAVELQPTEGETRSINAGLSGTVSQPNGVINLGEPVTVESLRLEVLDPTQTEVGHIHIWEIELRR